jgi:hypothetical protein
MKHPLKVLLLSIVSLLATLYVQAQCSICNKTATQMGEDAGQGINGAVLYLAAAPFLIIGYIGYRWYMNNRKSE